MPEDRAKSELDLLQTVQDEQVISQAALSERLGIAAGLVNFLMKRAISKGFVIAKRVPARRYAYFLTPKGMVEKARLVADYMNTSLNMFRHLRVDFDEMFARLDETGSTKIVVIGDIELIELAVLASLESKVKIVGAVCDKTNRQTIAGVPVISHSDLGAQLGGGVAYLVADIYNAQAVYDELAAQFGAEVVLAPECLQVDQGEGANSDRMQVSS